MAILSPLESESENNAESRLHFGDECYWFDIKDRAIFIEEQVIWLTSTSDVEAHRENKKHLRNTCA